MYVLFTITRHPVFDCMQCKRCVTSSLQCEDTGVEEERRCRVCCIEGLSCDLGSPSGCPPQEVQHDVAYIVAGCQEVIVLQQKMAALLMELVGLRQEHVRLYEEEL